MPKKVAEFTQFITKKPNNILNRCVRNGGEIPLITKYDSVRKEFDDIIDKIKREGWNDVGILVPNNNDVKIVKTYFENKGIEVEYKYDESRTTYNNLDFFDGSPKILTYHSSKGLQFEYVFLPECEINYSGYSYKDALYVAATRTYKNLFISYSTELSPFISNIPSQYYNFQQK